jgi:hypothetical protein
LAEPNIFCAPGVLAWPDGVRRPDLRVDGGPALEARRNGVVGLGILASWFKVRQGVSFAAALAIVSSPSEFRGVIRDCRAEAPPMLAFGARFADGRSRLLRLADMSNLKKVSEIKSLRLRWEAS